MLVVQSMGNSKRAGTRLSSACFVTSGQIAGMNGGDSAAKSRTNRSVKVWKQIKTDNVNE